MTSQFSIRRFRAGDARAVRDLFIRVNQGLAPPGMEAAFDAYVRRSLREEIDCLADYYAERSGTFMVAVAGERIGGMYGLETVAPGTAELRRMYVDPDCRGQGLGRALLASAEAEALRMGFDQLVLSTSELQPAALALYRSSGYAETGEEIAQAASNKTLGGGIRRFHFSKRLRDKPRSRIR